MQFRDNLQRIAETHNLQIDPVPGDNLSDDATKLAAVVQVVMFITKKAIEYSGKEYEKLTIEEAFAAGLVTMVAAAHLSRLAKVDFGLTGYVAGCGLWAPLFGATEAAEIVTALPSWTRTSDLRLRSPRCNTILPLHSLGFLHDCSQTWDFPGTPPPALPHEPRLFH